MAKKETKKKLKDKDERTWIHVRDCAEKADMGITRGIRACREDKPEYPRKRKIPNEEEVFGVLENKLDCGFTLNHAPCRDPDTATAARLKKMVERLDAKKKKTEDNK